jgi:hypothetical protein
MKRHAASMTLYGGAVRFATPALTRSLSDHWIVDISRSCRTSGAYSFLVNPLDIILQLVNLRLSASAMLSGYATRQIEHLTQQRQTPENSPHTRYWDKVMECISSDRLLHHD